MRPYDPQSPLVSIHIPKAGGTTLQHILQHWFPGDRLRLHYRTDDMPEPFHLRAGDCVHGHFNGARGFGVSQYYPKASQFIAFMRDPFERFVSHWFFMHRKKNNGERIPELETKPSFESWLHARAEEQRTGTNSYSPVWFLPHPPGAAPLARQLDESFVFLGLTERLNESVALLANILGKPPVSVPHLNATPSPGDRLVRWRGYYESNFADEYELYRMFTDRFPG
ncbi:MAG: sulfotransferase family 2 domain-containing protein [Rhodospirillales bacterium]|jgi:hypothetical protein|nr:sulfotransferase family 2 domain-containing protein [Rhodospirillales bacterium]